MKKNNSHSFYAYLIVALLVLWLSAWLYNYTKPPILKKPLLSKKIAAAFSSH